ncbi:hypothetical protein GEOBRER4_n1393 [Citrifermentans bremense]|uniref:Uncharacterized protein n=1 Tax=Citrifermentans bremense TaxID=60035 RepID=A0A7R7FSM0_9BACT|nr:hypothetical protein GEOBRER4_n1393 [Citrifermentans bremense]
MILPQGYCGKFKNKDLTPRLPRLGLRCVLAATLANLLNATIAGILFAG